MSRPALKLVFDPARVRAHFAAFSEPSLAKQAFFENAGGSYMSNQVLGRLNTYLTTTKVQPYAPYPASQAAGAAMDLGYARTAQALNVPVEWIHFGPSTSANTYTLANAFASWLNPGDAVIVTNQDHEANSGVWRSLSGTGVEIREWSVDKLTGRLQVADLERLLDNKVKLAAVTHCSNIAGEINPIRDIAQKVHDAGGVLLVDGVGFAPHGLPDLSTLGADIYLFSAYKTYGPHVGVMAIRPELADQLPNQGHFFNNEVKRKRLVPAGPDHAQVAAMAGVADYLEAVADIAGLNVTGPTPFHRAHVAMRGQEMALLAPLLDWAKGRNDLRLIGPADVKSRAPTVSMVLDQPGAVMAERLGQRGIMASGGHFYAYRLFKALGIDPNHGALRVSFVHYTSPEEVYRLIEVLDAELG